MGSGPGERSGKQNWGGARAGAGRPRRKAGEKRLALSVTVADRQWALVHLYAEQHGLSVSEVVDRMLACIHEVEPFAAFFGAWFEANSLEETLDHLTAGRERVVPKASPKP